MPVRSGQEQSQEGILPHFSSGLGPTIFEVGLTGFKPVFFKPSLKTLLHRNVFCKI